MRRVGIVALARRLVIALWRYLNRTLNAESGAERALVRVSGLYSSPFVAM
jgi:hypothetical protein